MRSKYNHPRGFLVLSNNRDNCHITATIASRTHEVGLRRSSYLLRIDNNYSVRCILHLSLGDGIVGI